MSVAAYVPTAGPAPRHLPPTQYPNRGDNAATTTPTPAFVAPSTAVVTTAPWRIALHLGHKPGYASSTSWPIVVPCDFTTEQDGRNRRLAPQQDVVRYTVQKTGQVVKPIQAGSWSLDDAVRQLSFTLSFPEAMSRNDLRLPADTTLTCVGPVYTTSDIQQLNANFYQARDAAWQVGAELNAMVKEKDGPKQWNKVTQQWNARSGFRDPLAYVQKRYTHATLWQRQNRENDKRPNPQTLSAFPGRFPGLPEDQLLFMGKQGVIRQGSNTVIGTWSAEPMVEDRPVSYLR
jgi:hypothetical protein